MVAINFIKQELPVKSTLPTDAQIYDFDHYGATPAPARELFTSPPQESQVPWWQPKSAPAPGPQEDYESEFQVPPITWPSTPTAQVKPPNRTTPTTLDQYATQLYLYEPHGRPREAGFNQKASVGSAGTTPTGWGHIIQRDYQQQLNLLEQQNKRRLETHEAGAWHMDRPKEQRAATGGEQQKPMGSISGRDWVPPPGWEESLSPVYQEALKYLREATRARNKEALTSRWSNTLQATPSPREQDTMARHRLIPTPESISGSREQSVDSVWSTQFTPESIPGFQEGGDIKLKFEVESNPNILNLRSQDSQHSCQFHCSDQDHNRQLAMLVEQSAVAEEEVTGYLPRVESQFDLQDNRATQDYQMQLMLLDQLCKRGLQVATTTQSSETKEEDENPSWVANGSRSGVLHRSLVMRER